MKLTTFVPRLWLILGITPVLATANDNPGSACKVFRATSCGKMKIKDRVDSLVETRDVVQESAANTTQTVVELAARQNKREEYRICVGQAAMSYKPAKDYYTQGPLYDFADWGSCNDFTVIKKAWNEQNPDQDYIAEHILERQAIKLFFAKVIEPERKWCKHIFKFWQGKAALSKLSPEGQEKWPLDILAAAFPADTPETWSEEMVRLESITNGFKQNMFQGKNFLGNIGSDWNTTPEEMEYAVATIRHVILLANYMNHPDVNGIYRTQAIRVGEFMEQIEQGIQKNYEKENPKYEYIGMRAKWLNFIKDHTNNMNKDLGKVLTDWKNNFEAEVKKGKNEKKNQGDLKELYNRVEAMANAIGKMNAGGNSPTLFKNPF